MKLLTNETIITKSDSDVVTLTSHRVRYKDGNSLTSIMLNQISGIVIQYSSRPILIIVAVILGFAGLGLVYSESNGTIAVAILIAAVITLVMFFSSRKHVISIQSASTSILFHTKGMNQSAVLDFVNEIEEAKYNYSSR